MHLPRITILMPVKSYLPEFLGKSIGSVQEQTSPNWKLNIIVEKPNIGKFRQLLAAPLRDERVRLVANGGRKLAGAFNSGMRQAGTDFVAILLADDMWAPEAVGVLTGAISAHPAVDFFHS